MDDDLFTASWCIGRSPIMLEDTVELHLYFFGFLGVEQGIIKNWSFVGNDFKSTSWVDNGAVLLSIKCLCY